YHDGLNEKRDVAAMNRAVFAALKPGGVFGIIDNSAKAGSGASDVGTLHRVDEQLVRDQVAAAGFKLAGEAGFLRNPADPRDWNADSGVNKTHDQDRFALRFVKDPAAMQVIASSANPVTAPWTGAWGGLPPFGKFGPAEIRSALDASMAENLTEID